jgi:phosphinothricin acetyltransferase
MEVGFHGSIAVWPSGLNFGVAKTRPWFTLGLFFMKLISCTVPHLETIRAIFNDAIATSTALYDVEPRSEAVVRDWFAGKEQGSWPVIGLENKAGDLLGFGTYGPFRPHAAYRYTVEHSVYVAAGHRGQGSGRLLLTQLIALAQQQGYHMMIGGIDAANTASIGLHKSLGFTHCGSIQHAGYKFGRWLDLEFYQLLLPER